MISTNQRPLEHHETCAKTQKSQDLFDDDETDELTVDKDFLVMNIITIRLI